MSLIVNAYNIHQGGGLVLLKALVASCYDDEDVIYLLDSRLEVGDFQGLKGEAIFFKPTVVHRLMAEIWLYKNVNHDDTVLCFGNLPPIFKLKGYVTVFLQNIYLIDKKTLSGFSLKTRLRIFIERQWLSQFKSNTNVFIVQTYTMYNLMSLWQKQHKVFSLINILPFIDSVRDYEKQISETETRKTVKKEYDFVYVASGEPHKNHKKLIEAWVNLSKEGFFPSLCVTLNDHSHPELTKWVKEKINQHNLRIENRGAVSRKDVINLYEQALALIYPSLFESFGLPLLEAQNLKLQILASELDYVRDLIKPTESFDPNSSISIARAVKRYLNLNDEPLEVLNAEQFISSILSKRL